MCINLFFKWKDAVIRFPCVCLNTYGLHAYDDTRAYVTKPVSCKLGDQKRLSRVSQCVAGKPITHLATELSSKLRKSHG